MSCQVGFVTSVTPNTAENVNDKKTQQHLPEFWYVGATGDLAVVRTLVITEF